MRKAKRGNKKNRNKKYSVILTVVLYGKGLFCLFKRKSSNDFLTNLIIGSNRTTPRLIFHFPPNLKVHQWRRSSFLFRHCLSSFSFLSPSLFHGKPYSTPQMFSPIQVSSPCPSHSKS